MLKHWISSFGSLEHSIPHSHLSALESLHVCRILSVFELEQLLLNNVVKVFVRVVHLSVVNKVVKSWIELSGSGKVDFIELLINPIILRISFDLTLKIVTVLLLFFSQIAKEVSVVGNPSLSLPVQHSSLSSFVVERIGHGSGIELLNFVEDAVEFHDGLLNLVPGFVDVAADWNLLLVSESLELFVDKLIGK